MSDFKVFPNSPAFPEIHISHWRSLEKADNGSLHESDNVLPRWSGGLTKREYFAALAMQGMLASCPEGIRFNPKERGIPWEAWAGSCVKMADALIEELNK